MTTDDPSNAYSDPFKVVDYDPTWAKLFSNEHDLILSTIAQYVMTVEHVGSTSIPGLAAKPIIDIQVVVQDFSNLSQCIEGMTGIGYVYKGLLGIEGREYFKRPGFHVHMVQMGNDEYTRKTLFLKYLREHKDVCQEYAELKKRLAIKWNGHPSAHLEYNLDKTEFIMGVLTRAGWDPELKPEYLK
ncbi:hypothetical protein GGI01_000021 [Coemansia sp. RSA 376]|nr:hypothetical protein GGI14_000090 [Coemansia sp. S680]KAJ2041343.1 hypothetical protein H4S03_000444 [Coemansia sp. S3946]KAJ2054212.1 hypothetical protein H4S04_000147 [Coemansia sp. S16]KAJ2069332.1 hypothetical protein GGI08_000407 [Coemansia sp. S2]KAJ2100178.1 hypothetical protein GGI16_003786 [Coemansia sp. S142-1]KAJ2104058.1 hypothetical protein GGI09_000328 [Coemansia sp. S100]KAJ2113061.1 hypothetical protein IW146_004151 [Coemansia sp. RSA 922]KAJ2264174.1 hypothetical protein 